MSLSVNDLQSRAWKRQVAAGNAVLPAGTRLMGAVLRGGTANSTLLMYNAATTSGADVIGLAAVIGDTASASFGPGGTLFDVGVSISLTGAGASFVLFYLEQ